MDVARFVPARAHRRPIAGRAALARALRRPRALPPPDARASSPVAAADLLDTLAVVRRLAVRPAAGVVFVAVVLALLTHVGAGALGLGIRPQRAKHRVQVATVAATDAADALPDDLPPPPPPPPPARATSTAPAPPTASSSTPPQVAAASSAPPSFALPSFAGVPGGAGFGASSAGAARGPLSSSRPVATSTPTAAVTAARPLRRVPPRFPADARRAGRTGVVVVQLRIDEAGSVVDARVVQSDPPGVFDAAALESVRGWTFAPATSEGHPVTSWVRQTIRFALEGS